MHRNPACEHRQHLVVGRNNAKGKSLLVSEVILLEV